MLSCYPLPRSTGLHPRRRSLLQCMHCIKRLGCVRSVCAAISRSSFLPRPGTSATGTPANVDHRACVHPASSQACECRYAAVQVPFWPCRCRSPHRHASIPPSRLDNCPSRETGPSSEDTALLFRRRLTSERSLSHDHIDIRLLLPITDPSLRSFQAIYHFQVNTTSL